MKSSNKDRKVTEAGKLWEDKIEEESGLTIRTYLSGVSKGCKYWSKRVNDKTFYHRVDGPAVLDKNQGPVEYWIDGMIYSKKEWLKHPLVKRHRLKKKLEKILS